MSEKQIRPETRRELTLKLLPVAAIAVAGAALAVLRPFSWSTRNWGLLLDLAAAVVMAFSLFKPERVIRSMATMAAIIGGYTDPEAVHAFRRDKYLGIYGMSLMAAGFLLQLL